MTKIAPFFSYFGSKYRAAAKLPAPTHETIVEPFAGSAGYSLNYPDHQVILCDADSRIIRVWKWLISAPSDEIAALPVLTKGTRIADLGFDPTSPQALFLGWHAARCTTAPRPTVNAYAAQYHAGSRHVWERIARDVEHIRHWIAYHCPYAQLEAALGYEFHATWFVDPPYRDQGKQYKKSSIDFDDLGAWCLERKGQLIVTEGEGHGDWLPFVPYTRGVDAHRTGTKTRDFVFHRP